MTTPKKRDELRAELVAVLGKPNEDGEWEGKRGSYVRFYRSPRADRWMIAFSQVLAKTQFYETVEAFLDAAADHFDIPITPEWLEAQGWETLTVEGVDYYMAFYRLPNDTHLEYQSSGAVHIAVTERNGIKFPGQFRYRRQLVQLIGGLNAGTE